MNDPVARLRYRGRPGAAQVSQGQVQEKEEQPEAGGCTHASEELVGVPVQFSFGCKPGRANRTFCFRVFCVPTAAS